MLRKIKEMKISVDYSSPSTEKKSVLTEGCFCGSAEVQNSGQNGSIDSHQVNTDFDMTYDNAGWDTTPGGGTSSGTN